MEFDLIGIDASIANAYRRIMMAEVPTVAIETVFIQDNTSVIPDEILAHRIGLLPIKADPRHFVTKTSILLYLLNLCFIEQDDPTDLNTLVFRIDARCYYRKDVDLKDESKSANEIYVNSQVKALHLEWIPKGDQTSRLAAPSDNSSGKIIAEMFKDYWTKEAEAFNVKAQENAAQLSFAKKKQTPKKELNSSYSHIVRPLCHDILVTKLRPGQHVEMELHCHLGIGKDHAKFTPGTLFLFMN